MRHYCYLLFVLLLLGSLQAVALVPEQYMFSLLDVNKGLSNNQVNCFLKDSQGYLWIGTADGLNRFDGTKVKVYQHDARDSSSIRANAINKIFEDPAGKLWIVTSEGLCIWDPVLEKFSLNIAHYTKPYKLPGNDVEDILKDQEGNYWFIITGQGISRYSPATRSSHHLKSSFSQQSSLSSNFVLSLVQNGAGDYWLIHRNGILEKLDGKSLKVTERRQDLYLKFNRQLLNYSLFMDSDDDLWVYLPYDNRGLFLYNPISKSFTHFNKYASQMPLNNNMVRGLVEAQRGMIWVATDHGGINIIDKQKQTVSYLLAGHDAENGLVHNSINTIYKGADNIIWLGTFKKGVNFYHENIFKFQRFRHQPGVEGSLPYDDVNRFLEDKEGNLWIGTNGGGLLYYNRSTSTYTRYQHDPNNPASLSSDVIVSLLIDKEGILWVGTYTGGLNRFDGKKFTHYKHDPQNPLSLPCTYDNVWELFQDSRGTIWVGTMKGGLSRFDPKSGNFYKLPQGGGDKALLSPYISAIAEDKRGNIWLGGSYGVEVLNPRTGQVKHYVNDGLRPQLLGSNSVLSIHFDKADRLWVGTQNGLHLFNEQEETFTLFTKESGLPHNTILTILEDDNLNLWVSTPNGLSNVLIRREEESDSEAFVSFKNYGLSFGLQGNVFNENAAYKTSRGELLFGGPNGYNLFHPASIWGSDKSFKLIFADFHLFNQPVEVGEKVNGRVLLEASLDQKPNITLRHNENVFSIEFAALNFIHPEKNKFKYMLEGFDRDWQLAADPSLRATYTNLDPGAYTFKVQASASDGSWNEEEIKLNIAVLAPFWRTNTAYFLYAVVVCLALYMSRRIELQRARMKLNLEQARREASQLHELDMMKIRFFTNVSHEFRTPLSLILAPLEKLMRQSREPEQQKQYQMIQRNAKRLLNLVNQLLDFRKLEVAEVNLSLSEGNIIKFIEESVHSFTELSEKRHISLRFTTAVEGMQVSFDMDKLEKILFNLLSNAFKFTPESGQIEVAVACLENDSASEGFKLLEILVKDTGIGIPPDKQEKIFERFFRNEVPVSFVNQGSGIGLSITKEFVKIHGGTISVSSKPGEGSCFRVVIPVKEICSSRLSLSAMEELAQYEEATDLPPVESLYGKEKPVLLLAEDNEDFRQYLRDSLQPYFMVVEAVDGKEGWQKALSLMPDLILSDLMMPQLNGIEFCRKIKADARTSQIPFVLLTAHTAEEQKLKGLGIGANDYITKPFNFELLLSRLKNLVAQRQLMQHAFEKKISVQSTEQEIVSLDDKLIQKAIQVVEEQIENPELTVELLSRELGVSRVHLYKKLVSITGNPPVEFIRKIRLERACQLLDKSQLTVAEVAYKVGFNNAKYFTKHFKREFNILPSQYASRNK